MRATSYRQAFRARWFVIVASTLLVTCLAVIIPPFPRSYPEFSTALKDLASPAHAKYQATAVIGVPPITTGGDAKTQFQTIEFYVQSSGVGQAFAKRLHYTGSDLDMLGRLIVLTADEKSSTMTVRGYGGTAGQAADITNAFTQSLQDYLGGLGTQATNESLQQAQAAVDSLKQRIDALTAQITALRAADTTKTQAQQDPQVTELQSQQNALVQSYTAAYQHLASVSAGGPTVVTAGLAVLQPAKAATAKKYGPGLIYELWLRIVLGVIAGLALGAALALLLEHNARKIFSREAAEEAFGARVLVEVPRRRLTGTARDVAVITAPRSRAASAYRMLRVILLSEAAGFGENGAGALPTQPRPALVRAGAHELSDPATMPAAAGIVAPRQGSDQPLATRDTGNVQPSANGQSTEPEERGGAPAGGTHYSADRRGLTFVVAATANERSHSAVVANLAASFVGSSRPVTVLRFGPSVGRSSTRPADVVPGEMPRTREASVAGVRIVEWAPEYGAASATEVVGNLQVDGGILLVDAGRVATAEFAEIAPAIDGVVAVCQIGRTTIENAGRTADVVAWSHARLLGVVLTQVHARVIERMTWRRRRRSPLTSRRRLAAEGADA